MNITPVAELSTSEAIAAIQIFDHFHSAKAIKAMLPKWDNETMIVPIARPVVTVKMLPNGSLTVTVGK
jgi:hypothetical protein